MSLDVFATIIHKDEVTWIPSRLMGVEKFDWTYKSIISTRTKPTLIIYRRLILLPKLSWLLPKQGPLVLDPALWSTYTAWAKDIISLTIGVAFTKYLAWYPTWPTFVLSVLVGHCKTCIRSAGQTWTYNINTYISIKIHYYSSLVVCHPLKKISKKVW